MRRISFIQSLVPPEQEEVIDLCCDHGQIGLGLVAENRKVFLVDIVPSITKKLLGSDIPISVNIQTKDATKIQFGKSPKKRVFIIAGVGGELGIKILKNLIPQLTEKDEVIISLHGNEEYVYDQIRQAPLKCTAEKLIQEKGKFYEIYRFAYEDKKKIDFRRSLWSKEAIDYINKKIKYFQLKSSYQPDLTTWLCYYLELKESLNYTK